MASALTDADRAAHVSRILEVQEPQRPFSDEAPPAQAVTSSTSRHDAACLQIYPPNLSPDVANRAATICTC